MILRPVDANGEILPVLSSADLLRGAPAVARLVKDRLELLAGNWWENPAWGNAVVDLLRENRYTEADAQALATYLTTYIRGTPGVQGIRDVTFSVEGKRFSFSCTVETAERSARIDYSV